MKAGRELDALIAEKVIGIPRSWIHNEPNGKVINESGGTLHIAANARYSTDIAAAWDAADVMADEHRKTLSLQTKPTGRTRACFSTGLPNEDESAVECAADTAPLAICLAALKALAVEVPNA